MGSMLAYNMFPNETALVVPRVPRAKIEEPYDCLKRPRQKIQGTRYMAKALALQLLA